jgi:hypothetical protein
LENSMIREFIGGTLLFIIGFPMLFIGLGVW